MQQNNLIAKNITLIFFIVVLIRFVTAPFLANIEWIDGVFHLLDCVFMFNLFLFLSLITKKQGIKGTPFTLLAFIQLFAFIVPFLNDYISHDYKIVLLFVVSFAVFVDVVLTFIIGLHLRKPDYRQSTRQMGRAFIVYSILNMVTFFLEIIFMVFIIQFIPYEYIMMLSYLVEAYFIFYIYKYLAYLDKNDYDDQEILIQQDYGN
jgi:hypothetical protein